MAQVANADTSSPKPKRAYRRGEPLSTGERKLRSVSRKKETHKAVTVFIQNAHKDKLDDLCNESGVTLAEMIEILIDQANSINK